VKGAHTLLIFLEFYNPGSGINIHYRIVNLLSFKLELKLMLFKNRFGKFNSR